MSRGNEKDLLAHWVGRIRANRVFSPIRIEVRVICVQSSLRSHFSRGRFAKKTGFIEARIDDRQITHLICVHLKHVLYDFLGGVLGLLPVVSCMKGPNTP